MNHQRRVNRTQLAVLNCLGRHETVDGLSHRVICNVGSTGCKQGIKDGNGDAGYLLLHVPVRDLLKLAIESPCPNACLLSVHIGSLPRHRPPL